MAHCKTTFPYNLQTESAIQYANLYAEAAKKLTGCLSFGNGNEIATATGTGELTKHLRELMTKYKKRKDQDNNDTMGENKSTTPEMESAAQAEKETETAPDVSMPEQQEAAELAAANDKYLRLYAEFDNYKRRISKERIELMQTAGKDIIANLLPVIDDFDRALKAFETATALEPVREGVSLVGQKLKNILTHQGLKEMESIGKPFDPELQEAITSVPAPNNDLKGKVIDEIEKGYFLHDKVLRHAKVVVGS